MMSLPNADETHRVPSGYFKVVYGDKGKSASFVMHQTAHRGDNFCDSQTALDAIQDLIRLDLSGLKEAQNR